MPYWVYLVSGTRDNAMPVVKTIPLGEKPAWRRRVELVGTFANENLAMEVARDMWVFYFAASSEDWAKYWAAAPAERAGMIQAAVAARSRNGPKTHRA